MYHATLLAPAVPFSPHQHFLGLHRSFPRFPGTTVGPAPGNPPSATFYSCMLCQESRAPWGQLPEGGGQLLAGGDVARRPRKTRSIPNSSREATPRQTFLAFWRGKGIILPNGLSSMLFFFLFFFCLWGRGGAKSGCCSQGDSEHFASPPLPHPHRGPQEASFADLSQREAGHGQKA